MTRPVREHRPATRSRLARPGWGWWLAALQLSLAAAAAGEPVAQLTAPDGTPENGFGASVAVDDDWLVVGAPFADGEHSKAGAAYVFRRDGAQWVHEARLTPADVDYGDRFGATVDVGGEMLVVGAWASAHGPGGPDDVGSVYVFGLEAGGWTQQARLTAPDAAEGDSFGFALSLSGGTLAVGAFATDEAGPSSGAVYVFEQGPDGWRQQAKLTADDAQESQYFGYSLTLDGDRMVVGARGDDETGRDAGAVYVFARTDGQWVQTDKLFAPDGAVTDEFGRKVAIHGGTLLVSATGDDPGGSVHVYAADGGQWGHQAKLTVADATDSDRFGYHISFDGRDAAIGAAADDQAGTDSGAVYVFSADGDAWRQTAKLIAAGGPDGLGTSVAVRDGLVVAGAVGITEPLVPGIAAVFHSGTQTAWRAPSQQPADWADPNNWTAGVPTAGTDIRIQAGTAEIHSAALARDVEIGGETPGELRLGGGTLHLRNLHLGAEASILADANAEIRLSGDLDNLLTSPGNCDLAQAALSLAAPSASLDGQLFETAGRDVGPLADGWEDNFALGSLRIEAGATLRLADRFVNASDANAGEALYVGQLTIEPGGRVDLGGRALYYRNGQAPRQLVPGDTNLDGLIDHADLDTLQRNLGMTESAGWLDGDSDGDGDVDATDYLAIKRGLGIAPTNPPPPIPEPAALLLLGLATPLLLARRRRNQPAA